MAYRKPLEAAGDTVIIQSVKGFELPFAKTMENLQTMPISRRVFVRGSFITILMIAVGPYLLRFLKGAYEKSGAAEQVKVIELNQSFNMLEPIVDNRISMPSFSVHFMK